MTAILGTPDANALDITESLSRLPRPLANIGNGGPDDRFSLLLTGAVANDTAYHRALVDLALNSQHYQGYADRYRRDLWLAADEPGAFPDEVPKPEFEEDLSDQLSLPAGFRHDPPHSQEEILAQLGHARSPGVAAWLLASLRTPSDAVQRSLAGRYLSLPGARARWAIVDRLAAWKGGAHPEPPEIHREDDGVTEHWEYPGLDAAVAAWKARLGLT